MARSGGWAAGALVFRALAFSMKTLSHSTTENHLPPFATETTVTGVSPGGSLPGDDPPACGGMGPTGQDPAEGATVPTGDGLGQCVQLGSSGSAGAQCGVWAGVLGAAHLVGQRLPAPLPST